MRIGLFLHRDTSFNQALFSGMKRGFEALGVTVDGATSWLDETAMHEWCGAFKPNAVIEMNRSRDEAAGIPDRVMHIAWIVDTLGRNWGEFDGSEILYLFSKPWRNMHRYPRTGLVDWLPPGFDDSIYRPRPDAISDDILFAGHIPLPWSDAELAREIHNGPAGSLDFAGLLQRLAATRAFRDGGRQLLPHVLETMVKFVIEMATGDALRTREIADRILRYDIQVRLVRMENRNRLLSAARRLSKEIAIYGPDNWRAWSDYAPFYRGFLHDAEELARAYHAAAVTLHEGVGAHFRVFDCMACGRPILYRAGSRIADLNELRELFEPEQHYLEWSSDEDSLRRQLRDRRALARMGDNAAGLVHQAHSWRHRAEKIIADIDQVGIRN